MSDNCPICNKPSCRGHAPTKGPWKKWKRQEVTVGKMIDAEKTIGELVLILATRKENHSAVLFDFEAAIKSGRLDAPAAAEGLLPMDKAPKDGSSILIYRKNKTDNQFCFVQASAYEGRFYADSRECVIDWEDGITSAIGWLPLPNTRAAGGGSNG